MVLKLFQAQQSFHSLTRAKQLTKTFTFREEPEAKRYAGEGTTERKVRQSNQRGDLFSTSFVSNICKNKRETRDYKNPSSFQGLSPHYTDHV